MSFTDEKLASLKRWLKDEKLFALGDDECKAPDFSPKLQAYLKQVFSHHPGALESITKICAYLRNYDDALKKCAEAESVENIDEATIKSVYNGINALKHTLIVVMRYNHPGSDAKIPLPLLKALHVQVRNFHDDALKTLHPDANLNRAPYRGFDSAKLANLKEWSKKEAFAVARTLGGNVVYEDAQKYFLAVGDYLCNDEFKREAKDMLPDILLKLMHTQAAFNMLPTNDVSDHNIDYIANAPGLLRRIAKACDDVAEHMNEPRYDNAFDGDLLDEGESPSGIYLDIKPPDPDGPKKMHEQAKNLKIFADALDKTLGLGRYKS